ncbi:replication-relaxation family protein [Mycolicibacterium cosmeticum]|uniref:replication-relaxation family protein n=1 Tax=Mycolicibacterium cosmeticum TaxID=258533 RepID=UPI0032048131
MTNPRNRKIAPGSDEQSHSTPYPIAHPIASFTNSPSIPVSDPHPPLGAANDGAHTGTTTAARPRRTSAADITAIAERLSDRDWAILRSVADHQFLTGAHISAMHFHDHTAQSGPRIARRTMARLRSLRVLGALERSVGGIHAGSSGLVHFVDVVGDQLLRGRSGRTSRRSREPSARFLAHRLAIADTRIDLLRAQRFGDLDVIACSVEPASWRRYTGPGGAPITLKPDLYVETAAADDLVYAWFLEVDLGTESLPTLLRKCRAYDAYRRSGIEQAQGGGFPLVVWSMTHRNPSKAEDRRQALEDAIATDRTMPSQLFRITAPQQISAALRAGGQQ